MRYIRGFFVIHFARDGRCVFALRYIVHQDHVSDSGFHYDAYVPVFCGMRQTEKRGGFMMLRKIFWFVGLIACLIGAVGALGEQMVTQDTNRALMLYFFVILPLLAGALLCLHGLVKKGNTRRTNYHGA